MWIVTVTVVPDSDTEEPPAAVIIDNMKAERRQSDAIDAFGE